ncbi:MAG: hypothetical protein DI539_11975 [Flavobacterium psychrophilum]|nr:MAG: hypothetical protein DI539_11975 [Flavobacterium psychrophilum]
MKRKKKNPFNVPDISYPPAKNSIFLQLLAGIVIFSIPIAFIGLGIYQFYKGSVSAGINSRGGMGVSYGGTSIAMGLFVLWLYYLEFKRGKNKKNPPKN